jgi:hypothetical protein
MSRANHRRQITEKRMMEMIHTTVQEVMKVKTGGGEIAHQNMAGTGTPVRSIPGQEVAGIEIEHGVPIPQRSNSKHWQDIYDRMVAGDSFVATESDAHSFVYFVSKSEGKTRTSAFTEGVLRKVRVWLVEKKARPVT